MTLSARLRVQHLTFTVADETTTATTSQAVVINRHLELTLEHFLFLKTFFLNNKCLMMMTNDYERRG